MPTTAQNVAVAGAIDAIRNAGILLTQQIRVATDTLIAIRLTDEYNNLDLCLSTLLHAQNASDDATFAAATLSIRSIADGLTADEATVKAIIKDVSVAGDVVKYIGQALLFIGKL